MTAKSDKANAKRYLWLKKKFHITSNYFEAKTNRHWISFDSKFGTLNRAIDREIERKVK